MEGERGFERGGAAAGDQDVRGHARKLRWARRSTASGATAGCECGKPAVESRRRADGGARRARAVACGPCTCSSPAAAPPPSKARSPSSAWPPSASTITLLSDRDEFVYRPVAVAEPFGFAVAAALLAHRARRRPRLRAAARRLRAVEPGDAPRAHRRGSSVGYDTLLLALGARAEEAVPGALTFRGPEDSARLRAALEHLHAGEPLRVAFVAAAGDRVDAAALRARAADGALGGRARARARAVGRDLGAPAADVFGEDAASRRRRAARRGRRAPVDRRVRRGGRGRPAVDQHRGRAAGRPRRRAAAPDRTAHPGLPADAHGFVPGRRARPRAGRSRRLRRRRHDHAAAQAGRPGDAAGRRRRRRDRRRRRAPTSSPRPTGRCCARCCSPAAVRATCAAPAGDHGVASDDAPWWPPHKIAGRELAPYLTAHPELLSRPSSEVAVMSPSPPSPAPRPRRRRRRRRARGRPRAATRSPRDRVAIELLAPGRRLRPAPVVGALAVQRRARAARAARPAARARRHPPPRLARAPSTPTRTRSRTTDGGELGYDRLIVATGARAVEGVPGATTFRGPISAGAVEGALRGARASARCSCCPPGSGWPLPIYELALLAAHELPDGPEIAVVTPEPRPLDIFGPVASDALARLLRPRRHRVHRRHRRRGGRRRRARHRRPAS